jgi:hypothetical protein
MICAAERTHSELCAIIAVSTARFKGLDNT